VFDFACIATQSAPTPFATKNNARNVCIRIPSVSDTAILIHVSQVIPRSTIPAANVSNAVLSSNPQHGVRSAHCTHAAYSFSAGYASASPIFDIKVLRCLTLRVYFGSRASSLGLYFLRSDTPQINLSFFYRKPYLVSFRERLLVVSHTLLDSLSSFYMYVPTCP
jgi:hypothetical protein